MPPADGAPVPVSPELAAVAAKIESGAADVPPAPGGEAPAGAELPRLDSVMSREDADLLARLGLDWILDAACNQYPVLSYPEETRARGARLGGAVLVKYDVLAWAGRWRAEFEFGVFVAGLAWGSYQQVQRAKGAAPVSNQEPAAASESPNPAT